MEPRIQYAKTSDGVNIAYAVLAKASLWCVYRFILFATCRWNGKSRRSATGINGWQRGGLWCGTTAEEVDCRNAMWQISHSRRGCWTSRR